ncbi:uncharacterized protein H6S33_008870 [Morchella sextelata]|uniref:uncharacterized protein n=1 Tax=Morchella sextelata TaxID=1174677 RepID=UPI001D048098|nr:uncharacterized protein H6S33_008870 [Morchella sextelata]KAH0612490.1 hypothetical protein H6S33_008870 [Morchella sextelata]
MMTRRLLLLVDFDETLTRTGKDTISLLASAAYKCHSAAANLPPWSYFVDSYMRDYNDHVGQAPIRTTLEEETEFQKSLRKAERASIDRVEGEGVFKGIKLETLIKTAAENRGDIMRKGWEKVVDKVSGRGRVAIVSVNWSRSWIRKCLEGSDVGKIDVFSNEFLVNSQDITTGSLDRWFGDKDGGIWTGWDKLRVMRDIVEKNSGAGEECLVVYVGDSTSDLLCLLEADVGVVFGEKLDKSCDTLGIEIREGLTKGYVGKSGVSCLARVEQWREIEEWVEGL